MSQRHPEIDVTAVQPSAASIMRRVAEVYIDHLGTSLVTLVAHGSAVKGGIIPGSSDVDMIALVRPDTLTSHGELPLEVAIDLHRDLARIDPAPFRYLQAYARPAGSRLGSGFIPGTFHTVTGAPDIPLATGAALLAAAHDALRALDPGAARAGISRALLNHGEGRLDRQMRWTCTDVWPLMYHVACIHLDDGLTAWQRTKHEVLDLLRDEPIVGEPLAEWFATVTDHYGHGESLETALAGLAAAAAFYDAVATWFDQRPRKPG